MTRQKYGNVYNGIVIGGKDSDNYAYKEKYIEFSRVFCKMHVFNSLTIVHICTSLLWVW